MLRIIPRTQTRLPIFSNSHYPGPFNKIGVCLHNMAIGSPEPISLDKAKAVQLGNYKYHLSRWGSIDIMEAADLFDVDGTPTILEGRPYWSNCDAFSGMAKLGYRYIGLEVYGNYDKQFPTDVTLDGIAEFLAMCYKKSKAVGNVVMPGHRDFNSISNYGPTSCPGKNLYVLIPDLIKEAKKILRKKESEEVMLPTPVDTKFVFPDIWQERYDYYIHFKDESGAISKKDDPTNEYRVIFTQGTKWDEIYRVVQGSPYERSSLNLKLLLRNAGISRSCAVTVLAKRKASVFIREYLPE